MDFIDQIKQLAERVAKLKDQISTEEATKNAFIMPMIQNLGYDVFNPLEVVPEFVADIGVKKGEKVDYAIMKDGKPILLIECKHWAESLSKHDEQLLRYFSVSKAKFGILTNGIQYLFFTDLVAPNIMDRDPFFSFDITEIREAEVEELKKFHKSYFQVETITSSASELKYSNLIKALFEKELQTPSEGLIRLFMGQVFEGKATEKNLAYFSEIVRKSLEQVVSDQITARLKSALNQQKESSKPKVGAEPASGDGADEAPDLTKIETTQEELDGYYIVKSILRKVIPVGRIFYRDQQSYFGILLDDNNRKPLCRLWFNSTKKYISLFDENKKESKVELTGLDDIYAHSEALEKAVGFYDKAK